MNNEEKKWVRCLIIWVLLSATFAFCFGHWMGCKKKLHIHQWKVGVATWKHEQYLERDDALGPFESSYYECIKCGKIRISGQGREDIFEPVYPIGE